MTSKAWKSVKEGIMFKTSEGNVMTYPYERMSVDDMKYVTKKIAEYEAKKKLNAHIRAMKNEKAISREGARKEKQAKLKQSIINSREAGETREKLRADLKREIGYIDALEGKLDSQVAFYSERIGIRSKRLNNSQTANERIKQIAEKNPGLSSRLNTRQFERDYDDNVLINKPLIQEDQNSVRILKQAIYRLKSYRLFLKKARDGLSGADHDTINSWTRRLGDERARIRPILNSIE